MADHSADKAATREDIVGGEFTTDNLRVVTMVRIMPLQVMDVSGPIGTPPYLGDIRGSEGAEEVWDGARWIPVADGNCIFYSVGL